MNASFAASTRIELTTLKLIGVIYFDFRLRQQNCTLQQSRLHFDLITSHHR